MKINNMGQKIGWIGLGKMGLPMAGRFLNSGFPLTVYNRTAEKTRALASRGARVAGSPKDVAVDSDVIFTMVSDDAALEEVAVGKNGVLGGAGTAKIFIDMSTISPDASAGIAARLAEGAVRYLRAPVSGSTKFAETGTLTIFVSGLAEAYETALPLFRCLGQKVFYMGPGEEARYLKLLINMMVGTTAMMVAEALAFGKKSGMDWAKMVEAVQNSVVASPLVGYKIQALKDRNFAPSFTATQIAKDFDLALSAGRDLQVAMPVTAVVRQFFEAMRARGQGDLDFFGVEALMEDLAGIDRID